MTKTLVIIFTVLTALLFAYTAKASSFLRGPEGTTVNGFFKDAAWLKFTYQATNDPNKSYSGYFYDGSCDSSNTCTLKLRPNSHRYFVYQTAEGDIYYKVDGGVLNFMAGDKKHSTEPAQTLYDDTVLVDANNPKLTVYDKQKKNINTYAANITVKGEAEDEYDSGIASVTVNGKEAKLSGKQFQVTVPLEMGIQTISVQATDKVGHIARDGFTVNRIAGQHEGTENTQTPTPEITGTAAEPTATPATARTGTNDIATKILYALGGIVFAVVILFVLAKFGVIKVKFSEPKA